MDAGNYAKQIKKIYNLADAENPPKTDYLDTAVCRLPDGLPYYNETFFKTSMMSFRRTR
ncbi:hypothetical protein OK016_29760 [Vibrio chagasii]|nr:hypothetical protein [Vibrio chagasii]